MTLWCLNKTSSGLISSPPNQTHPNPLVCHRHPLPRDPRATATHHQPLPRQAEALSCQRNSPFCCSVSIYTSGKGRMPAVDLPSLETQKDPLYSWQLSFLRHNFPSLQSERPRVTEILVPSPGKADSLWESCQHHAASIWRQIIN